MSMTAFDAGAHGEHPPSPGGNVDFSFLPKALIEKSKPFAIRYHELNGLSCLPDILWQPETRKFIEANPALRQLFKKSTSSRRAQKANEGLILIATLILSIESSRLASPVGRRAIPRQPKKPKHCLPSTCQARGPR